MGDLDETREGSTASGRSRQAAGIFDSGWEDPSICGNFRRRMGKSHRPWELSTAGGEAHRAVRNFHGRWENSTSCRQLLEARRVVTSAHDTAKNPCRKSG